MTNPETRKRIVAIEENIRTGNFHGADSWWLLSQLKLALARNEMMRDSMSAGCLCGGGFHHGYCVQFKAMNATDAEVLAWAKEREGKI